MTKDDARAFAVAMNTIAPYVPPMLMQTLLQNPICRLIETVANAPDQATQGAVGPPLERPKPQAVT